MESTHFTATNLNIMTTMAPLSLVLARVGTDMQVTTKIPETGETKVLGEIRDIVGVMALWSTYPPGFCVFVLANAVPSALALSQRRLFFVSYGPGSRCSTCATVCC